MEKKFLAALYCFLWCWSHALGHPTEEFLRAITVKNCGTGTESSRIVGGKYATHGHHPWMVSLFEDFEEDNLDRFYPVCGASVLNENWVLTAAHCIDYVTQPARYQILVGLHKLSKQNAPTVQKFQISKIVVHKDYDEDTFQNDIALLKTSRPIDIAGSQGHVNGICLPTTDQDPTGYAKILGWGHEYESGDMTDTLKEVVVPIIPRDKCNKAYDKNPYDEFDEVTEKMICAGEAKRDACQNDSGGPLFQTDSRGVATLIGIISYGEGCGERDYPGVYIKVSSYIEWIESNASE